jgi:hypothetical protein
MADFLALSQKWIGLGGAQIGSINEIGHDDPHELSIVLVDEETRDAMFVTCSQIIWAFRVYLSQIYPNVRMSIISGNNVDQLHFQLV